MCKIRNWIKNHKGIGIGIDSYTHVHSDINVDYISQGCCTKGQTKQQDNIANACPIVIKNIPNLYSGYHHKSPQTDTASSVELNMSNTFNRGVYIKSHQIAPESQMQVKVI